MERLWVKNYHQGVPAEIDVNSYQSLIEMLEKSCIKYGKKPAFSNFGSCISFTELEEKTRYFAAYLQQVLKLSKGDRIALMMPDILQYPVALFGAMRAGIIVVNINPLYTAAELVHILNDAKVQTILIMTNFAHTLQDALPQTQVKQVIVTELADLFPQPKACLVNFTVKYIKKIVPKWSIDGVISFKTALKEGRKQIFSRIELTHEDIAFLQYTGGTTGISKAAILTQRNMVANVLQLMAWVTPTLAHNTDQVIVTALPLYHIFSLTVNCLTFTMLGGLNVLITNPRDFRHFMKEIKNLKFTAISGVNTLFNAMVNYPKFKFTDFSHLRFTIGGGMAVQKSVAEKWEQITGCMLIEGYGLTEAAPVVTANPLNASHFSGSIGLPLPSTDVSIRDDKGLEMAIGEEGELCVKGPQVMPGYWHNPLESQNAFTADGWLRTGDIAKMNEEGYVFLVDRKKDMIIVSGFNVYPNEIEDVIAKHPGVLEVAVVGTPNKYSGEMVKAFIVKKDPNLTKEAIVSFCQESLTRYKIPKVIEFCNELPKTNVGKILRRALRD
jgi:long-chain acyl-CoA synthetase